MLYRIATKLCYGFVTLVFISSTSVFGQITVYSENFTTGISGWTAVDEIDPTDVWTATAGYMQINGAGGTNDVDWLISPVINLDAQIGEYFLFDYNDDFSGALIELLYSTNYSGSGTLTDVTNATWTSIPLKVINIDATTCFTTLFQRHPAINIGAITGTSVYFAFRYSGLSAASKQYRIDNVHIDANYYGGIAAGLNCAPLKTALNGLIKNQSIIAYTATSYDVWDALMHTDTRMNDAGTAVIVWDMFTDIPTGTGELEFDHCAHRDNGSCPFVEGVCYNREHTFPRSWWGGGTLVADTQNVDLHHVYASDSKLNGAKNNFPPGVVVTASVTGTNGFKVGTNPGYPCAGTSYFEPIDEFKGDYARTFFYFVTRYQHRMVAWETINAIGDCVMSGTSYPSLEPWILTLLLQWHAADPVSQKEIDHNNAAYAIQGNRNPFIDSPGFVYLVWGDEFGMPCSSIILPTELVNFEATPTEKTVELTWTTASEARSDFFNIERSIDAVNWNFIGQVKAAEFSNEVIDYQYSDMYPIRGKQFYRLKQVDQDGESYYSEIESVAFTGGELIAFYPNPTEEHITISGVELDPKSIRVVDLMGRDLTQRVDLKSVSTHEILLDLSQLEPNVYLILTEAGKEIIVKK